MKLLTAALFLLSIITAASYLLFPGPAYYALFLSALILCAACFFNPLVGLYAVIISSTIEMIYIFVVLKKNFYDMRLYPYLAIVLVSMLGYIVFRKPRPREGFQTSTPLNGLLLFVVAYELFAMFWTPTLFFGTYVSIMIIINISIFYLFTGIVTDEDILKKVITVWIIAGFIQATGIMIAVWVDEEKIIYFSRDVGLRLAFGQLFTRPGGLAGPSHASGFVATAIALLFANMLYIKGKKRKILLFILILYMIAAAVLSQTRGVVLSLMAGVVFFIYIYPHFRRKIITYSIAGILVVVIVLFSVQPRFINRILIGFGYTGTVYFTDSETTYEAKTSASGEPEGQSGTRIRIWWWENGFNAMLERPLTFLFGLGPGGFVYYSQGSPEVNSIFFAFFYDMGLIGVVLLILILYILLSGIRYYLRNAEKSYSYYMFLGVITALLMDGGIHALVDFDLNSYGSKNVWMPFSLTMAVFNILREEKKHADMARGAISGV